MFSYQTHLKSHKNYPYVNWNKDVQHYILLNLFWINFINQFNLKDWSFGNNYYVNFDDENDRDFSTDVIFIKNEKNLKKIAISPVTNYEKKFDTPPYSIGIFKQENEYELEGEYDILSIEIDISVDKNIEITKSFIEYFLSEKYIFEKMEEKIKAFELSKI